MPKTILVVDDEEMVRKTIGLILKDEYQIDFASGGMEGFQKAMAKDYDLMIVDLKMPDINGVEVIKKVKEKKPGARAVVLTGYYQEYKNMIQEIEPLILGVLLKPLELQEFRDKIKELIA